MDEFEHCWVNLQGAVNVRDLGGLPSKGGVTRHGVLYRSDSLSALSPADVECLIQELKIAHVIDLRTHGERLETGPGPLQQRNLRISELPVLTDDDLKRRGRVRASERAASERKGEAWSEAASYLEYLELGRAALVNALERLADGNGVPAIVHCTAGRDRTGALVAMLLDACGVQREAVVADYVATSQRAQLLAARINALPRYQKLAVKLTAAALPTHAKTMAGFLSHLDREFGGARSWFRDHGAREGTLDRWAGLLIK